MAFDNFKKVMSQHVDIGLEEVIFGKEKFKNGDAPVNKKCKCLKCKKEFEPKPNYFG
jgi:hypothetical protein